MVISVRSSAHRWKGGYTPCFVHNTTTQEPNVDSCFAYRRGESNVGAMLRTRSQAHALGSRSRPSLISACDARIPFLTPLGTDADRGAPQERTTQHGRAATGSGGQFAGTVDRDGEAESEGESSPQNRFKSCDRLMFAIIRALRTVYSFGLSTRKGTTVHRHLLAREVWQFTMDGCGHQQ